MLVLKRKMGQGTSIIAPDGTILRIIVTDTHREFVRIGFECPAEYKIMRDELGEWEDRDKKFRAPGEDDK